VLPISWAFSGHIEHNAIRHFKLAPALSGCRSGEAVMIQTGSGGNSTVKINANSVEDYQKNGITGNESGTQVTIDHNVVTGVGPTTGAAQNGIQVGFGAQGAVTNNSVANNVYSPCTMEQCSANGTGILIFQSDGVDVENNTAGTNQIGIAVEGQGSKVETNTVPNSLVLDGILLIGDDNRVTDNRISHSDQAGVFIQGNGNHIDNNEITEAAVGIFKVSGFTGNTLANNRIFATLVPVERSGAKSNDQASTHALMSNTEIIFDLSQQTYFQYVTLKVIEMLILLAPRAVPNGVRRANLTARFEADIDWMRS
jgi:parallel beta-helix repeat protein